MVKFIEDFDGCYRSVDYIKNINCIEKVIMISYEQLLLEDDEKHKVMLYMFEDDVYFFLKNKGENMLNLYMNFVFNKCKDSDSVSSNKIDSFFLILLDDMKKWEEYNLKKKS